MTLNDAMFAVAVLACVGVLLAAWEWLGAKVRHRSKAYIMIIQVGVAQRVFLALDDLGYAPDPAFAADISGILLGVADVAGQDTNPEGLAAASSFVQFDQDIRFAAMMSLRMRRMIDKKEGRVDSVARIDGALDWVAHTTPATAEQPSYGLIRDLAHRFQDQYFVQPANGFAEVMTGVLSSTSIKG